MSIHSQFLSFLHYISVVFRQKNYDQNMIPLMIEDGNNLLCVREKEDYDNFYTQK